MKVTFAVFVKSIVRHDGRTIVTAANGSDDGPPLVAFQVAAPQDREYHINRRLHLTIEDDL